MFDDDFLAEGRRRRGAAERNRGDGPAHKVVCHVEDVLFSVVAEEASVGGWVV